MWKKQQQIIKNDKLYFNPLKYKSNYALIDVETFNEIGDAIPYDISIAIYNAKHKHIRTIVLLLKDILCKSEFKSSAYFKDKLPLYFADMDVPEYQFIEFKLLDLYDMGSALNSIITDYNIKLFVGFNAHFDYTAINRMYEAINQDLRIERNYWKELKLDYKQLKKLLHNGFKKVNYFDLYYGFTQLLKHQKTLRIDYYWFCYNNLFITESGKCVSSREDIFYKWLIDFDHDEAHQGYKDIIDEFELYKRFLQYLKKGMLNNDKTEYLRLNKKVLKSDYGKYGLYNIDQVKKSLVSAGYPLLKDDRLD